jgi:hypothetical protein
MLYTTQIVEIVWADLVYKDKSLIGNIC